MNTKSFYRIIGSAILIAPLLAGCGADGAGGGGGDVTVPTCNTGEVLSTNAKGQLICKALPVGTVSLPQCKTGEALTGDLNGVECTNLNNGGQDDPAVVKRITDAENTLIQQEMRITMAANRPAAQRIFKGTTTMSYNGNFQLVTGATNGFDGANRACEGQFGAGARLCTVYDIYHSAVKGAIGMGVKEITKSWVYFPAWNNPLTGSQDPLLGMGDTCGSLTYPTNDLKWSGVAVSTGALKTTRWGVRFHGGSEALCNAPLPLACCQ